MSPLTEVLMRTTSASAWTPLTLAFALAAGGVLLPSPPVALVGAGLVALVARRAARPLRRVAFLLALSLVASAWASHRAAPPPPVGASAGPVDVVARLAGLQCDADGCRAWLEEPRLATSGHALEPLPAYLPVWVERPHLPIGAALRVRGQLVRRDRDNPDPFDDAPRFRLIRVDEVAPVGGPDLQWRYVARARLASAVDLADPQAQALYRALLAGDRTGLPAQTRDAFVDTGTAHLLAISGLHLALLGWGLFRVILAALLRLFTRAGQTRRLSVYAAALALALTWAFALAVGRTEATARAALLLTAIFGAEIVSRRPWSAYSLALAALAILAADPLSWRTPSFQLSFAAVASLVLVAPHVRRLNARIEEPGVVPRRLQRATRVLAVLAIATLVTFLATAPLALAWFGQLAPAALLVNLVAVPLTSLLVVPVGFVWLGLALALPGLAALLSWLPELSASLLLDLVDGWAHVVGSSHYPAIPVWLGLVGTLAVLLLLGRRRWLGLVRRASRSPSSGTPRPASR